MLGAALGVGARELIVGQSTPSTTIRSFPPIASGRRHFDEPILVGDLGQARQTIQSEPEEQVLLRRVGVPRVIVFDADDVDVAVSSIEKYVAALRADYLRERTPGNAALSLVRILWRTENEGAHRRLRVVVIPTESTYHSPQIAERYAESLGWWAIANGVYPVSMTRSGSPASSVSAVSAPSARFAKPVFEAAEELFEASGFIVSSDEVADGVILSVARDSSGGLVWVFSYCADQHQGSYAIINYGNPFDVESEEHMLLAIMARALRHPVGVERAFGEPR